MKSILDNITGDEALCILRNLCAANSEMRENILAEAEKVLKHIDFEYIAGDVSCELEALDLEDLFNRSGPSRYGYTSPEEMAFEMVEEALEPFKKRIAQYQVVGMHEQAKQYCMGVLWGIYLFEQESESEFREYAPDAVPVCFKVIHDDWRRRCVRKRDHKEVDQFIARECPKWAG